MPLSFGTVSDDGSKDADRYSISGSELEAMARAFSRLVPVRVLEAAVYLTYSNDSEGGDEFFLRSKST